MAFYVDTPSAFHRNGRTHSNAWDHFTRYSRQHYTDATHSTKTGNSKMIAKCNHCNEILQKDIITLYRHQSKCSAGDGPAAAARRLSGQQRLAQYQQTRKENKERKEQADRNQMGLPNISGNGGDRQPLRSMDLNGRRIRRRLNSDDISTEIISPSVLDDGKDIGTLFSDYCKFKTAEDAQYRVPEDITDQIPPSISVW